MSSSDSELEFTNTNNSKGGKKSKNQKQLKSNSSPSAPSAPPPVLEDASSGSESESEDSSSDDTGYGKQQALGIDPLEVKNYDGISTPQNGSQYLLSVIQETKKSPKVVVADVHKNRASSTGVKPVNYLDSFHKEVNCNVLLKVSESNPYLPSQEWRDDKLKDFSILRSKVEQLRGLVAIGATRIKVGDNFKLPETGNRVVWQRFCFGLKFEEIASRQKETRVKMIISAYFRELNVDSSEKSLHPLITKNLPDDARTSESSSRSSASTGEGVEGETSGVDASEPGKNGCRPLMSLMLLLPQQQIRQLIYYQSEWIDKYGFINKCQGEWLYALLSCVEKPLEPSSMADIRMICKSLIIIRNNFIVKLSCNDSEAGPSEDNGTGTAVPGTVDMKDLSIESDVPETSEYINSLNLFIYLIADYFSQKDLVTELL